MLNMFMLKYGIIWLVQFTEENVMSLGITEWWKFFEKTFINQSRTKIERPYVDVET